MIIVIVFSSFFVSKDEIFEQFVNFYTRVENEKLSKIDIIRGDNKKEFKNINFDEFYFKRGYKYEYSAQHTPR
jgi:rRNA maturation protein Rpf1